MSKPTVLKTLFVLGAGIISLNAHSAVIPLINTTGNNVPPNAGQLLPGGIRGSTNVLAASTSRLSADNLSYDTQLTLMPSANTVTVDAGSSHRLSFRPIASWGYHVDSQLQYCWYHAGHTQCGPVKPADSVMTQLASVPEHAQVIASCKGENGQSHALPLTLESASWQGMNGQLYHGSTLAYFQLQNKGTGAALDLYDTHWRIKTGSDWASGTYTCSVSSPLLVHGFGISANRGQSITMETHFMHTPHTAQRATMLAKSTGASEPVAIKMQTFTLKIDPAVTVSVKANKTSFSLGPQDHYSDTSTLLVQANTNNIAIAYECIGSAFDQHMCAMTSHAQNRLPYDVSFSDGAVGLKTLAYSTGLSDAYTPGGGSKHYFISPIKPGVREPVSINVAMPDNAAKHAVPGQYNGQMTVYIYAVPKDTFSGL